jgi:hypothetical protein
VIRTADAILADIRAHGDELNPDVMPAPEPQPRVVYRHALRRDLRGLVDIDLGVGRLTSGWADIHRYARVWAGTERPADLPERAEDKQPTRGRPRVGCRTETQYRRHLADGEKCGDCWDHMRQVRAQRRREGRGGK